MIEFALPDVGEGLTEAEISAWHVAVGDTVEINDILVDIETAKSVVELPSPAAGVISAVHAEEGMTVHVGTVIISIEEARQAAPEGAVQKAAQTAAQTVEKAPEEPLVLVGKAPTEAAPRRRRLTQRATRTLEVPSAARSRSVEVRETRIPVKGVRRANAAAVTTSAFTAPHATVWLTVDITRTMELLGRLRDDRSWQGVRLTPLVFVARAFLLAIRRFPDINARWDEESQEIVVWHHVNLGIAAATPRGLIVPNIKDSDRLDLTGLAQAIDVLVQTARSGRTSPEEMSHGTITITNIGALGVDAGTPILNAGEAAILALGAVRETPWVVAGEVVPRMVTQLAMSFDHRLVDGALGSHVLAEVGRLLSDPGETFLYV